MELLASSSDLAAMGAAELVRVSASTIPRAAPRTLALLTACLVVPLSLAMLAHSHLVDPILLGLGIQGGVSFVTVTYSELLKLIAYQSVYVTVLYTFAVLSTAAAVFTVASLSNKPAASMSSSSFPDLVLDVLANLLDTFSWASLITGAHYLVFMLTVSLPIFVFFPDAYDDSDDDSAAPRRLPVPLLIFITVVAVVYLGIHVYVSAVWHLANVVSVLEPLCGLDAMARSKRLLQGRTGTAATLVAVYLAVCGATWLMFRAAVVEGSFGLAWPGRLLVGVVLVCVLVGVNLLGLLVQSVLYYSCKAFHNL